MNESDDIIERALQSISLNDYIAFLLNESARDPKVMRIYAENAEHDIATQRHFVEHDSADILNDIDDPYGSRT